MLTKQLLMELLIYDSRTGVFIWREDRGRLAKKGQTAGTQNCFGYIEITIKGKRYRAHRLAFLYMAGKLPKDEVDHINTIRNDNRWENLREATRSENSRNGPIRKKNKAGYKGVCWHKRDLIWRAQITVNYKVLHLGNFIIEEEAALAYNEAALKYFGEYAKINEMNHER